MLCGMRAVCAMVVEERRTRLGKGVSGWGGGGEGRGGQKRATGSSDPGSSKKRERMEGLKS